ncbi:DUF3887 domain-containing protein [Streptomyces sp. ISL-94]|uniref:DUF3887 domain-containing protein n=1 Tax=Streptomyces sp. ISL-94 TaxID=2819190 RepID=UPI001BEAADE0|nr:DUF3887 domain-containing protein [Streptomyces sp. ISL-94]MBT2482365.1 DUF3887 domain-containing protein [Streptomyces sp. ISL-94]
MALISRKDRSCGGKRRLERRFIRSLTVATVASSALFVGNDAVLGVTQARASAEIVVPAAEVMLPRAVTVPRQPQYKQLALDTLAEVIQGSFTAVSSRFDEAMQQKVSPEALEQSWKSYQAEFGRYQSHGDPQQVASGSGTVVNVPLRMAKQPGEFRVTFNESGRITGLYFLRTGVPVP